MDRVNALYGKENAALRNSVWNKGFKGGHLNEYGLSLEMVEWLDKATDAYYRNRIYKLLTQVGLETPLNLTVQWNDLMDEMFGNSHSLKQELVKAAMTDETCTHVIRDWLQKWICGESLPDHC